MSTAAGGWPMGKTWDVYVYGNALHGKRPCRYVPKGKSYFYLHTNRYTFSLTAKFKRGIALTAQWVRGDRLLGRSATMFEWEYPSMAIKKRQVVNSDVQHLAAVESSLMAQHMALVEHCALRKYDDGTDREVGWFTVKVTGAAWVVQVKDPDSCMSFAAVADTLDKAFDTANLLLACDEAPWEHDVWLAKAKMEKDRKKSDKR